MRLGRISQFLTPGYSHCLKCRTTWPFVKHHSTQFTQSRGMFPLCEQCWAELTPETRLPFYRRLWLLWANMNEKDDEWPLIERAVLDGK